MYVGMWKNDRQNGHGKLVKKNGDVFDGEFKLILMKLYVVKTSTLFNQQVIQ